MTPGDIFTIQIENQLAVGQIILKEKQEIYVIAFEGLYNNIDEIDLTKVLKKKIAIVARTLGLFFKLKRWKLISHYNPVHDESLFPNYKINTVDGTIIVDFKRSIIRNASKEDEEFYFFYNSYSPAFVVGAIKAYHSLIPMDADYKKLTYEFIKERSNVRIKQ